MKTTLLVNKKLDNLSNRNTNLELEMTVRRRIIYEDLNDKGGFISCSTEDIWMIAFRSWYYGVSIIGVESNIDEDNPLYDFCIEDYVDDVKNFGEKNATQWIITALMPLVIKKPGIQLKFYIDIPEINIPVLEKTIEGLL